MPLKFEENFEGTSWANRTFFYFCLFSSLLIIFLLVFISFTAIYPDFTIPNGPHYNTTELRNMGFFDNERYLISALVQSLAATIALVITLSLVAVQLAAQSYSARVIDVYKNNPDMWILLSIYIAVIFYGLGLLKVIDVGVAGINMELAIFAAYFLGFFAFMCLVPYMLKTLNLLKPSTIITLLAIDITKEKVLTSINAEDNTSSKIDPVQPIADMANSALERNDYATVRDGLTTIKNSTIHMLENIHFNSDEEKDLAEHILKHLQRIGIQAVKKENEDSTLSAITCINEIGIKTAERKLKEFTVSALEMLKNIGTKAVDKKLELAVKKVVLALWDIGTKAAGKELNLVTETAVQAIWDVGAKAEDENLETIAEWVASALWNVGWEAAVKDLDLAVETTVQALRDVGIKVAEDKSEKETLYIENGLEALMKKAKEKGWTEITKEIKEAIQTIEYAKSNKSNI